MIKLIDELASIDADILDRASELTNLYARRKVVEKYMQNTCEHPTYLLRETRDSFDDEYGTYFYTDIESHCDMCKKHIRSQTKYRGGRVVENELD